MTTPETTTERRARLARARAIKARKVERITDLMRGLGPVAYEVRERLARVYAKPETAAHEFREVIEAVKALERLADDLADDVIEQGRELDDLTPVPDGVDLFDPFEQRDGGA